jgi:hypothetical protein
MGAGMSAGLDYYRRLFGAVHSNPSPVRRGLDRASLPSPLQYLSEHGLAGWQPRGEEAKVRCPVHKGGDERKPSHGREPRERVLLLPHLPGQGR